MIPTPRTAYINARLLDPASNLDAKGAVLCENGKILDYGPRVFDGPSPEGVRIVDTKGACLAPGLIDMRVHTGEPGNEHKENFQTLGQAAAAGGVTAIAAMPNTTPIIHDVAGVAYIDRRARQTKSVKTFPYATMTVNGEGHEMTEMGLLAEAGAIGFTDGTHAVSDLRLMRRIMAYARTFDLLVLQPAIHPRLVDGAMMNAGEVATRLGLAGVPAEAEPLQVMTDLRLAQATGARIMLGPISMAESADLIRAAKAKGIKVSASTCPHYFTLTENDVGDYRTFTKVMPPLRNESDRRAIADAVADGTIDVICSNHCPQDVDSKRLPYAQAAFGIVGLETLLTLSLRLCDTHGMSLLDLLARLTVNPAHILRLSLGKLEKGGAADFTIFDPGAPWVIVNDQLHSKAKNSPYDGLPTTGRVLQTVLDGRHVFELNAAAKAA